MTLAQQKILPSRHYGMHRSADGDSCDETEVGPCPICGAAAEAEVYHDAGRASRVMVKCLRLKCTGCRFTVEHENHGALRALWSRGVHTQAPAANAGGGEGPVS